jgi:hypothetical protein
VTDLSTLFVVPLTKKVLTDDEGKGTQQSGGPAVADGESDVG